MAAWNPRANEIFASVLELLPDQRPAALEQACGADAELRRQVETLLAAHAQAGSFLDQPDPAACGLAPSAVDSNPARPAGASVLQAISASLAVVPRVHLRDPEGEALTPVARPGTDNMPDFQPASDRLQLHGEIARGGMGAILKGRDIDLGRDLAVKVLLEGHQGKSELVQRFVEEAQIAGQLQHPGVVPVYELGQFGDGRPYFTMKLVKGKTLAALLAARPEPAEERSKYVGIFGQVCQTLAYAHARGVIHRDLKPANVMVGAFGEVQVMDWGLAKVLKEGGVADEQKAELHHTVSVIRTQRSRGSQTPEEVGSYTLAGSMLGTPAYMSPEQARGEVELIDERADVFGLGAILCEILTGRPPYVGKKAEVQRRAQTAGLEDAYSRLEGCGADAELVGLARRCLAAEPWDRPRDAGQVTEAVTSYQNSVAERLRQAELAHAAEVARAEEARVTATEAEAKARAERRSRHLTLALAASLLLAVTLGATGWRWVELERRERVSVQEGRVNAALQEAIRLRGQAQGVAVGDLAPWAEAVAAARKAEALLEPGVDLALREQAATLVAEVTAEEKKAEEAVRAMERDRQLLDRLVDIRSTVAGDDPDGSARDTAYAEAFHEAGMDVDRSPPAQTAARIRARPEAVTAAMVGGLDDWTGLRRESRRDAAGTERLLEVLRLADPDSWRGELRAARALPDTRVRLAALQKLAQTVRLDEAGLIDLYLLGKGLKLAGDSAAAEKVLRAAQQRWPGDLWVNYELARVLEQLSRTPEAIRYYLAARALHPETAHQLGHALEAVGEKDEGIVVFQELVRIRPDDHKHRGCLIAALAKHGRTQEMAKVQEAAYASARKALGLHPDAAAYYNVGRTEFGDGARERSLAAYRKAIALKPDYAEAYLYLGKDLVGTAPEEAIAAFRRAIEIKPDYGEAYFNLGFALGRGRSGLGDAIAAYKEASRLMPEYAPAHYNLGVMLERKHALDEAQTAYREVIRLSPDYAEAHCNLGGLLRQQGRFAESLACYRRGHELGSKQAAWRYPSAEWVRRAERDVASEDKLQGFQMGQYTPQDNGERLGLAAVCYIKHLYYAAARLYADAIAADPKVTVDLSTGDGYDAACAAVAAAAGQGEDATALDDKEKSRLRGLALDWHQTRLKAMARLLQSDQSFDRARVQSNMQQRKTDPKLASVRDPAALEKLPPAEQAAWQTFWTEVEALLQRSLGETR
jgi:serine/threonine-protein kinase